MLEQENRDFCRKLDLTKARVHYPPRKEPASHQSKALRDLHAWLQKGHEPAGGILVIPTGGGKTFVAIRFLCSHFLSEGYKVLWLAHTHHLLEQAYWCFAPRNESEWTRTGIEAAKIAEPKPSLALRVVSGTKGHFPVHTIDSSDDVVIGTLQTICRAFADPLQRGLRSFLEASNGRLVVVFDEAHHAPAPSYRRLLEGLRQRHAQGVFLGLTATPTYSDETKQGWLKKLFPQGIVSQVSAQHLMADRILARPKEVAIETHVTPDFDQREFQKWVNTYQDLPEDIIESLASNQERNARIVSAYVENREKFGKTIIFADRWYQCDQFREMLRRRGVKADVVYAHVECDRGGVEARRRRTQDENSKALEAFRRNEIDVLINVRMLTEGTDVPDVRTVFLTRQTTSSILITQMVGRALRGPKFGGTEEAYIVSFVDDWKLAINWAEFDQLTEGLADDTPPEYGKRPPLHLISIELVWQLARQMDSGINYSPGPFLTLMPTGWYLAEYDALVEGTEDTEPVRQLVMVYENQKPGFERFIDFLLGENLEQFAGEGISFDTFRPRFETWREQFFRTEPGDRHVELSSLWHLARHIAQSEGNSPRFFPFEDRQNHDLDVIVSRNFEKPLSDLGRHQVLQTEYVRADRYWRVIYPNYPLFKSQYDACVNRRIAQLDSGGTLPTELVVVALEAPDREPSEDVKRQVRERDGNRCLCCGETRRRTLQTDHIAPFHYGGNNSLENLQTLCRTCNQMKAINELNFRVHRTLLTQAPHAFRNVEIPPETKDAGDWEIFVRRSLNLFYQCSAVNTVTIRKRGHNFYNWEIELWIGNDPEWLRPHLNGLLSRINCFRERHSGQEKLESLRVTAPGSREVRVTVETPNGGPPKPGASASFPSKGIPTMESQSPQVATRRFEDSGLPLTADVFVEAFQAIRIEPRELDLLKTIYRAAEHTISPKQMADRLGLASFGVANLRLWNFAGRVCNHLGLMTGNRLQILVDLVTVSTGFGRGTAWRLRQPVAEALEKLGWV